MTQPSPNLPPSQTPIRAHHIRAPQGDGEALIEPPLREAEQKLLQNRANQKENVVTAFGFSLEVPASVARFQLINNAVEYSREYCDVAVRGSYETPVVLAGHQPELFHPGVWLKNFVAHETQSIPNRFDQPPAKTVAINLVVDNDTAGNVAIRIPAGNPAKPHLEEFLLDDSFENVPFEERPVVSSSMVSQFVPRLKERFAATEWYLGSPAPALLAERLGEHLDVPRNGKAARPFGETFARARHRLEQDLGLSTLELPLSRVADSETFQWFVHHICSHLPHFREIYNQSLAEYRAVNRIRSNSHPVPALEKDGDWTEAPFWIWTSEHPRRERLFARTLPISGEPGRIALELTDRKHQLHRITGRQQDFLAGTHLEYLVAKGIKIRPRALITTMYARLFLSDLFIHGIGGAKYDELTDAIIRRFFGIEPPTYMTVTGTVRLPIPRPDTTAADVRRVKQLIREIRFHPEKFVNDASPAVRESAQQFADKKVALLREHQFHFRQASPEQFRALDDLNRQLSALLTDVEVRLRDQWKDRERDYHANRLLGSREFSFVLHPADALPDQLKQMASQL
jgi:hypothetical protein